MREGLGGGRVSGSFIGDGGSTFIGDGGNAN